MDNLRIRVHDLTCTTKCKALKPRTAKEIGLIDITLRPYQVDGIDWMIQCFHSNHGCILGDEMGLGKTCQTIGLMTWIHGVSAGQHLVVCPLSVLGNWKEEFARFSPKLNVVPYVGDKDYREEIRNEVKTGRTNFDVLVTTYEICMKDAAFLGRFSWGTLVIDEAHRLKNKDSLLHQILKEFRIRHPVLLTGTPIQNNLKELYSLLSFVAPIIFNADCLDEFIREYGDLENRGRKDLQQLLKPFLLRRIKLEVVELPSKTEVVLKPTLTALQKKCYKAILTKNYDAFESNSYQASHTRMMNILVQLRKCVNHPYLFHGIEPEPFKLGEHLVEVSGKLILIDQLLKHLKATGHKVLLFSQMTRMLDIMQDYLGFRGYSYERLDGSVRGEERFLAVKSFNSQQDCFIFLLSTRAGGQGLNLVSADTIIFIDSDFNPQNDLQAAARAHRIGQNRPVKIVRLVGQNTVDEIILHRSQAKLKLTANVIEGGQFSGNKENLIADNYKLEDVIKFGFDKLFDEMDKVEQIDIEKMLGKSENGRWVEEKYLPITSTQAVSSSGDVGSDNMYVFEGKDYSKEPTVRANNTFNDVMQAKKAELSAATSSERGSRKRTSQLFGPLADKPRRPLTDEEKKNIQKKRAETLARKALEEQKDQLRKFERREKKREALWASKDYVSCNITLDNDFTLDSDNEDSDEEDELSSASDESNESDQSLHYVSGDVTRPVRTKRSCSIIVHCVDDSGVWGSGGIFSAISSKSETIEKQYELAGEMKDLRLGDVHIISLGEEKSGNSMPDLVALIVAQHRDRHSNLSGVKLTALCEGFKKIHQKAHQHKASVHMPRIGFNTPDFNWYATERQASKLLAIKGIPTYIYYFPRNNNKRQRLDNDNDGGAGPSKKRRNSTPNTFDPLPSFMAGTKLYFHDVPGDKEQLLRRYVIAYNGDVQEAVDDATTHCICSGHFCALSQVIKTKMNTNAKVVPLDWLEDCIRKQTLLNTDNYEIDV